MTSYPVRVLKAIFLIELVEISFCILGDLLIIIASVIVSIQMVYEQKFVTKYNVPPLLAVGLEGTWLKFFGVGFE